MSTLRKHPLTNTVLILGPTGRFGRHAAHAFEAAGWDVRRFDRARDRLWDAAWGASVIVNGWNPPYPDWADEVPSQTREILEVARASGATVVLPGNVYGYGADAPSLLTPDTPHAARNPLGRVRIEMEAAYRAGDIRTIVVRAGDYIDTQASGNWFDKVIAAPLAKGKIHYPGPLDTPHAFTFLPDVARTVVALAEKRDDLPRWVDVNAPSYALTGRDLAQALTQVTRRQIKAKRFAWWPLIVARPFWRLAAGLLEMRYLWNKAHFLDDHARLALCPDIKTTPLNTALAQAIAFTEADASTQTLDPDRMPYDHDKLHNRTSQA